MNLWWQAMREEAREIWLDPYRRLGNPLMLGAAIYFLAVVSSSLVWGATPRWLVLILPATVALWHLVDTVALFRWGRRQIQP